MGFEKKEMQNVVGYFSISLSGIWAFKEYANLSFIEQWRWLETGFFISLNKEKCLDLML